jgi:transcription-repair coupling factor (superfamily II helicase)
VKKSKKVSGRGATRKSATKKGRKSAGSAISTSSPLGMLALYLREQWKKSGRDGLVFLAEDENRAERLGGIVHALDPSLDVLVFPRLNTLPFDGLEPSREIAGRRSSVLRRLARRKKPILLVSTAEAIMERLPLPASWSRISLSLKVQASYAEQDLEGRMEELGYDLDEEGNIRAPRSFTARHSRSSRRVLSGHTGSSIPAVRSAELLPSTRMSMTSYPISRN